jgi:hypothetical protein
MYKTTSRNLQRSRDSGGHTGAVSTLRKGEKRAIGRQRAVAQSAELEKRQNAEAAQIIKTNNLARLGGWRLERFDAAGARLGLRCLACGLVSPSVTPLEFARLCAHSSLGTQLRMALIRVRCSNCGKREHAARIVILGSTVVYVSRNRTHPSRPVL